MSTSFRPSGSPDVLIVDGMNLAFKSFFTLKDLSSQDEKTGVVFGVLRQIISVMNQFWPKAVVVCWEGRRGKARRLALHPGYKARRKTSMTPEDRENLYQQVETLQEVLSYFGVAQLTLDDFEGDDIMYAFATRLAALEVSNVIISGDQDLLQALSPYTKWYDTTKTQLIASPEEFKDLMGFPLERFVDWKCLVGDKSDDIPGIIGVGAAAVQPILSVESLEEFWAKPRPATKKLQSIWDESGHKTVETFRKVVNLAYFQTPELFSGLHQHTKILPPDFGEAADLISELGFASLTTSEVFTDIKNNFSAMDQTWFKETLARIG